MSRSNVARSGILDGGFRAGCRHRPAASVECYDALGEAYRSMRGFARAVPRRGGLKYVLRPIPFAGSPPLDSTAKDRLP
jgi:hypothetical protein